MHAFIIIASTHSSHTHKRFCPFHLVAKSINMQTVLDEPVFFWLTGKSKSRNGTATTKIPSQDNNASQSLFQSNPNSVNQLDPDLEVADL